MRFDSLTPMAALIAWLETSAQSAAMTFSLSLSTEAYDFVFILQVDSYLKYL